MNATKRKLDAILQRIGTRSSAAVSTDGFDIESGSRGPDSSGHLSSSTTTTTGDMAFDSELLAKRRRLLHATTGTTATAAASGPTTISNVVLRKWNPDGGVSTSSFKRPAGSSAASTRSSTPTPGSGAASSHRYSPTDRSALISRLATFQELTDWTPKPDRIGELAWARRGWVCVGKERVRCTLCGREVVVRLAGSSIKDKARGDEEKENGGGGSADGGEKESAASTPRKTILAGPAEITDALVDKFEEFIVTGHGEDCLWRKRGCDGRSSTEMRRIDSVVVLLLLTVCCRTPITTSNDKCKGESPGSTATVR